MFVILGANGKVGRHSIQTLRQLGAPVRAIIRNADQLSLAQIARQGMPDSPNSADTLAWAYYHKGVYQLATDLLEQALKTQPNNATYHYHLGLAYQKMSDPARAKTHLEKSLQLPPNSPDAGDVRKALNEITHG